MKEQNLGRGRQDALERTLTSLYAHDTPQGFSEKWRRAIEQEASAPQKAPPRASASGNPFRLALPAFAALLLAVGIWAVSMPVGQRQETPEAVSFDVGLPMESMSLQEPFSAKEDLAAGEAGAMAGGGIAEEEPLLLTETTSKGSERKVFGIAACAAGLILGGGIIAQKSLSKQRKK